MIVVALEWFGNNLMKLNADKCHLSVPWQRCDNPIPIKIGNAEVAGSSEEKLLQVHIDSEFTFNHHESNTKNKSTKCEEEL